MSLIATRDSKTLLIVPYFSLQSNRYSIFKVQFLILISNLEPYLVYFGQKFHSKWFSTINHESKAGKKPFALYLVKLKRMLCTN